MQARSSGEAELLQSQRRRRDAREADRAGLPRRTRRRRRSAPWLQRNALSVAAISVLVALLGFGFGLLQMLTRPEPAPAATLALTPLEPAITSASTLTAASFGPSVQVFTSNAVATPADVARPIRATAKILEPNYTIATGDTLVQIAVRFSTSVDRVQAFNNLTDPRALRIGTKLVIPPPL